MKIKAFIAICTAAIFLGVGSYFILEKESKIDVVEPEVKAEEKPPAKKVKEGSVSVLPGSRGN